MLKIDISHKINQRNIEIHINDDAPKIYAIQGPSGIGKTTILNMIAGLKKADQAEIEVNQRILTSSSRRIQLKNSTKTNWVFISRLSAISTSYCATKYYIYDAIFETYQ